MSDFILPDIDRLKGLVQDANISESIDFLRSIQLFAEISLDNQQSLGTAGYCEYLVEILMDKRFEAEAELCDVIFFTLVRFCRRNEWVKATMCIENCDRILANRGGRNLLESLSNFILEPNHVIGTACLLFMCLSSDSQARQHLLAEEGVSVALAAVLFKYSSEDYFAEMGSRAVRNLSTDDQVASVLVSEGICEALVKVLKESTNPTVLENALWAVVNLACDERISSMFGAQGIFKIIIGIMDTHLNNFDVIDAVASAIRNLTSESQFNASILSSNQTEIPIVNILFTCLQVHLNRLDAIETLLWACANVGATADLGIAFYNIGIIPFVKQNFITPLIGVIEVEYDESYCNTLEAALWIIRNVSNCASNDANTNWDMIKDTIFRIKNIFINLDYVYDVNITNVIIITFDIIQCLLTHLNSPFSIDESSDIVENIKRVFATFESIDFEENFKQAALLEVSFKLSTAMVKSGSVNTKLESDQIVLCAKYATSKPGILLTIITALQATDQYSDKLEEDLISAGLVKEVVEDGTKYNIATVESVTNIISVMKNSFA